MGSAVLHIEMDWRRTVEILAKATRSITPSYFQLPVAGREDPTYRERVYCYELYHQMRLLWPKESGWDYSLGGEVDKTGHPFISQIPELAYSKPDFLIHQPGNMDNNLLAVEVKPCESAPTREDLLKLTAFCKKAGYYSSIYLVYGPNVRGILTRCLKLEQRNSEIDLKRITLLFHQHCGHPARPINWTDTDDNWT